ncbi:hypothetical protein BDN72DRAFT_384504 [Pluteus cervinus]|uniref:Uncharacterized protein n=1 Tax=Pluteus cervinus TaxID=181527 RepID=A0ACD3AA46_9AGAR|nr:hypothetical protein BDN72DRAFT_384504 [Pluteus cervinus]
MRTFSPCSTQEASQPSVTLGASSAPPSSAHRTEGLISGNPVSLVSGPQPPGSAGGAAPPSVPPSARETGSLLTSSSSAMVGRMVYGIRNSSALMLAQDLRELAKIPFPDQPSQPPDRHESRTALLRLQPCQRRRRRS